MYDAQFDITVALLKSLYAQRLITENTYHETLQRLSSTLDKTPDYQYNVLQQNDNLGAGQYGYT